MAESHRSLLAFVRTVAVCQSEQLGSPWRVWRRGMMYPDRFKKYHFDCQMKNRFYRSKGGSRETRKAGCYSDSGRK